MTPRRTHHKQVLPNRRFARLLPTAMATVALAGASFTGPAAARADANRSAHANPPATVATTLPAPSVGRETTQQPNAAAK
jgi:hypothetical protein